jgi:hypothetical protein
MSVEQFQQQLLECFNGSQDSNVQAAAQTANQYTEMVKSGQLSREEYVQLLSDIQQTNIINKSVDNQQAMEYMNVAINGLINIASIVG